MDVMEIIILIGGMAFFGVVPPFAVGWYILRAGEKRADKRVNDTIAMADAILTKRFDEKADSLIDRLLDRTKESLRDSLNGFMGNKTKEIKKTLAEEMTKASNSKVPLPMQKVIGDALGGFAEDYVPGAKKNIVSKGIMALFNKTDPNQLAQQQRAVQTVLTPEQQMIVEDYKSQ